LVAQGALLRTAPPLLGSNGAYAVPKGPVLRKTGKLTTPLVVWAMGSTDRGKRATLVGMPETE